MNICYSGGAIGADTLWDIVAKHLNHEIIHYSFEGHKTNNDVIILTDDELKISDKFLKRANKLLSRKFPTKSKHTNSLLRRNYYQIKNSDSCYAIASIDDNKVSGGTTWAVTMFIQNRNGNCYILNKNDNEWYYFNRQVNMFLIMDDLPPIPSGKWTGIGSRDISKILENKVFELIGSID